MGIKYKEYTVRDGDTLSIIVDDFKKNRLFSGEDLDVASDLTWLDVWKDEKNKENGFIHGPDVMDKKNKNDQEAWVYPGEKVYLPYQEEEEEKEEVDEGDQSSQTKASSQNKKSDSSSNSTSQKKENNKKQSGSAASSNSSSTTSQKKTAKADVTKVKSDNVITYVSFKEYKYIQSIEKIKIKEKRGGFSGYNKLGEEILEKKPDGKKILGTKVDELLIKEEVVKRETSTKRRVTLTEETVEKEVLRIDGYIKNKNNLNEIKKKYIYIFWINDANEIKYDAIYVDSSGEYSMMQDNDGISYKLEKNNTLALVAKKNKREIKYYFGISQIKLTEDRIKLIKHDLEKSLNTLNDNVDKKSEGISLRVKYIPIIAEKSTKNTDNKFRKGDDNNYCTILLDDYMDLALDICEEWRDKYAERFNSFFKENYQLLQYNDLLYNIVKSDSRYSFHLSREQSFYAERKKLVDQYTELNNNKEILANYVLELMQKPEAGEMLTDCIYLNLIEEKDKSKFFDLIAILTAPLVETDNGNNYLKDLFLTAEKIQSEREIKNAEDLYDIYNQFAYKNWFMAVFFDPGHGGHIDPSCDLMTKPIVARLAALTALIKDTNHTKKVEDIIYKLFKLKTSLNDLKNCDLKSSKIPSGIKSFYAVFNFISSVDGLRQASGKGDYWINGFGVIASSLDILAEIALPSYKFLMGSTTSTIEFSILSKSIQISKLGGYLTIAACVFWALQDFAVSLQKLSHGNVGGAVGSFVSAAGWALAGYYTFVTVIKGATIATAWPIAVAALIFVLGGNFISYLFDTNDLVQWVKYGYWGSQHALTKDLKSEKAENFKEWFNNIFYDKDSNNKNIFDIKKWHDNPSLMVNCFQKLYFYYNVNVVYYSKFTNIQKETTKIAALGITISNDRAILGQIKSLAFSIKLIIGDTEYNFTDKDVEFKNPDDFQLILWDSNFGTPAEVLTVGGNIRSEWTNFNKELAGLDKQIFFDNNYVEKKGLRKKIVDNGTEEGNYFKTKIKVEAKLDINDDKKDDYLYEKTQAFPFELKSVNIITENKKHHPRSR